MSGESLHRSSMMCAKCGFGGNIVLLPLLLEGANFRGCPVVFVCGLCSAENKTSVDLECLGDTEGKIVYEIRHHSPAER